MKKFLIILFTVIVLCVVSCGCSTNTTEASSNEPDTAFITLEKHYDYYIVYHRDTHVMYAVSRGIENVGTFTLLVDAEGNPMIWAR